MLIPLATAGQILLAASARGGWLALLAQDAPTISPFAQFAPFVLIAVLAYFLFVVPQRNKERRYQQMINDLKQHDHVITSGGVHGVVTSINKKEGEVTLRIDEATGTKIQVSLWAIDSVPTQDKKQEKSAAEGGSKD